MAEKMHHSVNPMTIRDRETKHAPHSADAAGEVRPPNPVEDPRERLPTGPAHHKERPQSPRPLRTWVRSPGQANPTPRVNAPPIRMRSVCLGAAQPVCRFPGLLDAAAPFASPGSTALPALLASPSTAIQPRPAAIRLSLKRAKPRRHQPSSLVPSRHRGRNGWRPVHGGLSDFSPYLGALKCMRMNVL